MLPATNPPPFLRPARAVAVVRALRAACCAVSCFPNSQKPDRHTITEFFNSVDLDHDGATIRHFEYMSMLL